MQEGEGGDRMAVSQEWHLLWIAAVINISRHRIFFKNYVIRLMDFKIFLDIGTMEQCFQLRIISLNSSVSTNLI